ncbi:hypothetical protein QBC39DRAFT_108764 [Podospora conica]|nr:hypothetical protein QBC39DRAFT_108764 [Schizothecium conicum]
MAVVRRYLWLGVWGNDLDWHSSDLELGWGFSQAYQGEETDVQPSPQSLSKWEQHVKSLGDKKVQTRLCRYLSTIPSCLRHSPPSPPTTTSAKPQRCPAGNRGCGRHIPATILPDISPLRTPGAIRHGTPSPPPNLGKTASEATSRGHGIGGAAAARGTDGGPRHLGRSPHLPCWRRTWGTTSPWGRTRGAGSQGDDLDDVL